MLRFVSRDPRPMNEQAAAALSAYDGVTARLLFARGIETAQEARAFLHPGPENLHDPMRMHGMAEAVRLLTQARQERWPVAVYGDYDVDGVCACSLLTLALRRFGLEAQPHVPLRCEGYGLNAEAVARLAAAYRMLVTVDLGITNHEEVRLAQRLGMKVIVTDHHSLGLQPSPADAVLNPLLGEYPFRRLCGAGVALKLAQALLGLDACLDLLDLAALATVADIVPLTGENRALVAMGLPVIAGRKREGMRALLAVSGDPEEVDAGVLGFRLGPRLNAAGRLDDANKGVRLMLTQSRAEADALAQELDELNTRRKAEEARLVQAAEEEAARHDFLAARALIVYGKGWNVGVIGLAASRLCQKYHCPACALSLEDGVMHGSLRSVPGINIHECLTACDDLLLRYGGHELAAGVTLKAENYDAFAARLQEIIGRAEESCFIPRQPYDAEVSLTDCTEALERSLARLAPFGEGNPAPLLLARALTPEETRAVGAQGAHLKLTLRQETRMMDGIAFSMGSWASRMPPRVDAVFSLGRNIFRGETRLQLEVKALRPDAKALRERLEGPQQEAEALALLRSMLGALAFQAGKSGANGETLQVVSWEAMRQTLAAGGRGHLLVARTRACAREALKGLEADLAEETAQDPRCFLTVLLRPDEERIEGHWRHVWLLDGAVLPGEGALWRQRLPQAQVHPLPVSETARELVKSLDADDEGLRNLYRALRRQAWRSAPQAAQAAGLTLAQAWMGLYAFSELGLLSLQTAPFGYALLGAAKCRLEDSPILALIRSFDRAKGGSV